MTDELRTAILERLQMTTATLRPVAGGDISDAYQVVSGQQQYFVKVNEAARYPAMFEREARGLAALRAAATALTVPEVIAVVEAGSQAALILEWLPPAALTEAYWQQLGMGLAQLHRHTAPQYGWVESNYIGSLVQHNAWRDTWSSFYATQRILPQLRLARDSGLLTTTDTRLAERLLARLDDLCPVESPALTHGDLWSGNAHACTTGAALIDPAVSYAHREVDLAMTRLFGGFGAAFYEAYTAAYPLAPGFLDRMSVYQLYPVLVHVNLFGGAT